MERKTFAGMNCSVAQCLEVIGEWWTMLIIRDLVMGVRRFDEFQERLGISRNVLTQRLGRLIDDGIVEKTLYQDHPPRYEYRLTEKGRDLWPILTAMRHWGDRYAAPNGARLLLRHRSCGHVAEPVLHCPECGEDVTARDYTVEVGPGGDGALLRGGRGTPAG
ncbi:MAG TPA: helix-turn-helix domain-containing protein [Acidimicrobiales bacterium]|nr:helix-turn-helix domain-containing protein [Acidimicrobiales bacterium]